MAGLEPATAALTVRGSTIELHPNWLRESDSNRRVAAYETAAGATPVNPAFFADVIASQDAFATAREPRHSPKRNFPNRVTPHATCATFFSLARPRWRTTHTGRE